MDGDSAPRKESSGGRAIAFGAAESIISEAGAPQGPQSDESACKVNLHDTEYQTISRLQDMGETENDVMSLAIRWLDALHCLSKNCKARRARFSLEELNKIVSSRTRLMRVGCSEDKTQAILRACFCEQGDDDLREAFDFFDQDRDDRLSKEELRKALPLMGEKRVAKGTQGFEDLFQLVDETNSGAINFDEFVAFVKGMNPKGEGDDFQYTEYLDSASADAAGYLGGAAEKTNAFVGGASMAISSWAASTVTNGKTAHAATQRLSAAGASEKQTKTLVDCYFDPEGDDGSPNDEQLRNCFRRLDVDRDNMLDGEQLKKYLMALDPDIEGDDVDALFAAADKHDQGRVSYDEFAELMANLVSDSQRDEESEEPGMIAAASTALGNWFG